jgi:hypothetical protein
MNKKRWIWMLIAGWVVINAGFLVSCGQNRLKTDEKALSQKILTEEERLAQEAAIRKQQEKLLADSLAKLPKGFRFEEQREADGQNPPVVINIAGSLENIRDLKLSDVASEVRYIRLDPVPDTSLPRYLKYKYYQMDNYLVALNLYGIHLFTKEGRFIRSVVKNQLREVEYDEKTTWMKFWNDYTLVGGSTFVWARGNSLFYIYSNNISGQRVIMEYDCSKDQLPLQSGYDPENPDIINGLGEVSIDLTHGNHTPPEPRKHQGMMSMSVETMYSGMGIFSPDRNTYITNLRGNNMLGILGKNGDTLATFTKYERLKNYTKSVKRGTDFGTRYERGGQYFFRSNFNDTVFQIIPPNKLLPVYVLNLGKYKISMQEGVDPGVNLEGKIIPQEWAVTKNNVFLTFTKDNYDCLNNRKNKSVKIFHAIFTKSNQQLQIVRADPYDYEAPVLINDIDGGYPVWPLSYQVGQDNEILVSLKGNELKKHVGSAIFVNSQAPENRKEALRQFAGSVKDDDDVLMIIK